MTTKQASEPVSRWAHNPESGGRLPGLRLSRWSEHDRETVYRLRDAIATALRFMKPAEGETHRQVGDACGEDLCGLCLAESILEETLRGELHWPHNTVRKRRSPA